MTLVSGDKSSPNPELINLMATVYFVLIKPTLFLINHTEYEYAETLGQTIAQRPNPACASICK